MTREYALSQNLLICVRAFQFSVKVQMRRVLKFLGCYIGFSLIAAIGLLLFSFPNYPKSPIGWGLLLLLALPLTLAGELFGDAVWRNPVAKNIELRTPKHCFSWLRISYVFISVLLIFGLAWGISYYLVAHNEQALAL